MWIVGMLVGCTLGLDMQRDGAGEAVKPRAGQGLGGLTRAGGGGPSPGGGRNAGGEGAGAGSSGSGSDSTGSGSAGSGAGAGDGSAGSGAGPSGSSGGSGPEAGDDGVDAARPPAAGELAITELMMSPDEVAEDEGEWIEVANVGSAPVLLTGLVVTDGADYTFTVTTAATLAPGAIFVMADSADVAGNGGVVPDHVYDPRAFLLDDVDRILLRSGAVVVDEVDLEHGFPHGGGASLSLDPRFTSAAGNDSGDNWCKGASPYGAGDNLGTPGAPNPPCSETSEMRELAPA